jgi:hypothetical protein
MNAPQIMVPASESLVSALSQVLAGKPLSDDARLELQCVELQARVARFNARKPAQEAVHA